MPNSALVHAPAYYANRPRSGLRLKQLKLYFDIVRRKLITRAGLDTLVDLRRTELAFQVRSRRAAKPLKFTFICG